MFLLNSKMVCLPLLIFVLGCCSLLLVTLNVGHDFPPCPTNCSYMYIFLLSLLRIFSILVVTLYKHKFILPPIETNWQKPMIMEKDPVSFTPRLTLHMVLAGTVSSSSVIAPSSSSSSNAVPTPMVSV